MLQKPLYSTFLILLLSTAILHAQEGYLTGSVRAQNGDALAHVTVRIAGQSKLQSDLSGKFSAALPAGSYRLQLSLIGYQTLDTLITVQPKENYPISFTLQGNSRINEVVEQLRRIILHSGSPDNRFIFAIPKICYSMACYNK